MTSIRLKTLLYNKLVLLVFVPLLVLILVIMAIHSADIRRDITDENKDTLANISGEITDNLREPFNLLQIVRDVYLSSASLNDGDPGTFLQNTVRNNSKFESIFILNSLGRIIAGSLSDTIGTDREEFKRRDFSRQEFFQQVRRTGKPFWSDTFISPHTGKPTLTLAVPAGEATVVGTLNLDELAAITARVLFTHQMTVGILNRRGQVISHTNREYVKQQADFSNLDIVRQSMRGNQGAYRFVYKGREYIGCIATIPETSWMVLVAQDAGVAYRPIYRMGGIFLGGLLISVAFVLYAASQSISRILAPLSTLTASARAITDGHYLDFRPPYSIYEVDELGEHFRTMARAIQARESELHERNYELMSLEEELRQQLEENFRHQEEVLFAAERMETILASIGDGFFAVDSSTRFTYFNGVAEQILGRKQADVIGEQIWEILPEAAGSVFQLQFQKAMTTSQPVFFTAFYEPAGLWLEFRFYPFDDGLTAFFRNVTDVKLSDERLAHSREFYLKIFEESPSLIWRSDPDGKINYFNRRWLEFTGRALEESLEDRWQEAVHPDDIDMCRRIRQKSLQTLEPFSMEYRLRYHDASYHWIIDYGRPFNDLDDRFAGFIGTSHDISQRKNLEEQLLHAQRMESIGTLAGGIAHDFNNILTVIIGCSNMAQRYLEDNQEAEHYVSQVIEAANRAAGLTQNLLTFSRKQMLEMSAVDLNDIVESLEKLLRRIIREDINMAFDLCGSTLTIMADPGQLDQVIINLTTNALDAMPGGGRILISTRLESKKMLSLESGEQVETPCAVLEVADSGTGMDRQTVERIFDPFFTTKDIGKGTGLGLAIAYGIITQHRGRIDVKSEPGQGTVFTIYLPLTDAQGCEDTPAQFSMMNSGNETILLAEDDPFVRNATSAILEFAGYRIITAVNGQEAVASFEQFGGSIDLVLLDVIMPVMNGMDAYRRLRRIRPDIPVIFLSGYTAEILHQEGVNSDEIRLLKKPVSPGELLAAVRETLDAPQVLRDAMP